MNIRYRLGAVLRQQINNFLFDIIDRRSSI